MFLLFSRVFSKDQGLQNPPVKFPGVFPAHRLNLPGGEPRPLHGTSRLADLTRHIRHMIQVGGLDLVALGSDFDGIDCPLELEDAGHMDRLVQAMEGAGFTPREIEAVCWKNAWEFYRRVL